MRSLRNALIAASKGERLRADDAYVLVYRLDALLDENEQLREAVKWHALRADGRFQDCTGDCGDGGIYCCSGAWALLREVSPWLT